MNLRMVIPIEIAVIGLLGAAYYGYHAVTGPEPEAKPDASSRAASATPTPGPTPTLATERIVSKKGGFAVGVPEDVTAKKVGSTITMTTADKVMSALAGPVERGTLAVSSKAFMREMKLAFKDIRVVRTEKKKIDGLRAKVTYGRAENAQKVKISFVNVVIKAEPRNYAINAFTAADSDPLFVVPRVNTIIDSFEVIQQP